jgi:hypothetical protein
LSIDEQCIIKRKTRSPSITTGFFFFRPGQINEDEIFTDTPGAPLVIEPVQEKSRTKKLGAEKEESFPVRCSGELQG